MLSTAQQHYYAWDIRHKKSTSDDSRFTGVLSEAKVDLNPHQVEAALFAFESPLSKGAILADEVGLGKTIEAGIILSELWAEQKRKILIIVPASLRTQWNIELMEKFYLPSIIMERNTYDSYKSTRKDSPFVQENKIIICSYNFAVKNAEELSAIHWDVVVLDEAHKLRNVYKRDNITGNILKEALRPYKKLLLTATPLQNNLKELYGLISIIDDQFFSSVQTFDEQYNKVSTRDASIYGELKSRIAHIAHRTLRSQVQEYVNYTQRIAMLQEYTPSREEVKLYYSVSDYLMREETFGIPKQCRPLLTMMIRKIMSSSAYALQFTLFRIVERLSVLKATGYIDSNISSILSDEELDDDLNWGDIDEYRELTDDEKNQIDSEINEINEYIKLAKSIKEETKARKLLTALSVSFEKVESLGAKRKALIFTESCKTQEYLYQYLSSHGYQNKVICFNGTNNTPLVRVIYNDWLIKNKNNSKASGSISIDKKQALVDFFQSTAEVMIATEAGAEGINLQFCSLLVNYDMPWNPQRIEQRIGRCHRYGQKHDVVVVNFVNQLNAADRRVYQLLDKKFNLFEGVFGSSDEILGAIDSSIDFESRLNKIYRTCRTEEEIIAAFDALQEELETLIEERVKQTRKSLLENFDEDVLNKLKDREENDNVRVTNYINHFWLLAKAVLSDLVIHFSEEEKSFYLETSLGDNIPKGKYSLCKELDDSFMVRSTHPLGQYILSKSLEVEIKDEYVEFDLTNYPYRSMLMEQFQGQSGWMSAMKIASNNAFDEEEHILFGAVTDDGELLPTEFGQKLMELNAITVSDTSMPSDVQVLVSNVLNDNIEKYKEELDSKNAEYANYEIEKYESWSDDKLVPVENEVRELRKLKDSIHRQIRKETDVKQKLLLKRQEIEIDVKLRKKQSKLFELEDEYRKKVDEMTIKLLDSMKSEVVSTPMFNLRWRIV